jgi:lysophospholipase L1-like esterase
VRLCVGFLLILALTSTSSITGRADAERAVALGNAETIVFYGDSITQQNLYSAYLETFLLSRFPQKRLTVFNFGWSGDTAPGGARRFQRDVPAVKPTLVFVNFGMNDGGYKAFDEETYRYYMEGQRALADAIRAAGAREVLFTTSPVDETQRHDLSAYNDTLSRMADGILELARQRQLPAIDLFHPMLEVQRRAKEQEAAFTMIPDAIHPDPVGHLVMAYIAMRAIDAPREVGQLTVDGTTVTARGVTIRNVTRSDDLLEFDLALPFLPFYVPSDARRALELVPLREELNRFTLQGTTRRSQPLALSIDGRLAGTFTPEQLARGVDLGSVERAPWTEAGRRLWEAAQFRWNKHFEAWREMGLDRPAWMMPELPAFDAHVRAQRAYADELGRSLRSLAQPGTYHATLAVPGMKVPILSFDLSPTFPFDNEFDRPHPPETNAGAVKWTTVPVQDGELDFAAHHAGATNVVGYARVTLEADRATTLHLAMGSDDGLAVFVDGKRAFARDVMRPLRRGEDEMDVRLTPGRHDLVFKVTQGGGGYALAVDAQVLGTANVTQVTGRNQ